MKWGSGATAFELSLPSLIGFLPPASFTTGDPNIIRLREKEQQIQIGGEFVGLSFLHLVRQACVLSSSSRPGNRFGRVSPSFSDIDGASLLGLPLILDLGL